MGCKHCRLSPQQFTEIRLKELKQELHNRETLGYHLIRVLKVFSFLWTCSGKIRVYQMLYSAIKS